METVYRQTDCTPRYLLTHKQLVEKMAVYLELIRKASVRVNNRRELRGGIYYRRFIDEPKIEMAEAALNRLITRYRELFFELYTTQMTHPIEHTDKKYIQF